MRVVVKGAYLYYDKLLEKANIKNDDSGYTLSKSGKKYGFKDKDGEIVYSHSYDEAKDFREGMAAVQKGGKWGFLTDMEGKDKILGIPCQYDYAYSFAYDTATVELGGKQIFIDKAGVDISTYLTKKEVNLVVKYKEEVECSNGYDDYYDKMLEEREMIEFYSIRLKIAKQVFLARLKRFMLSSDRLGDITIFEEFIKDVQKILKERDVFKVFSKGGNLEREVIDVIREYKDGKNSKDLEAVLSGINLVVDNLIKIDEDGVEV